VCPALPRALLLQCINLTPDKGLAGLLSSFFFGFWNLMCGFLIPQSVSKRASEAGGMS